jgi:alkanesulfonate monooxygenase SsuD/methylene tetrahydromethanopterin reductase-like flavin-dependent oxidoreductase (luciferase family)
MVAGAGPRMLRLAAREADIVNIAPRPPVKGTTSRGSTGFGLTIQDELAILKEAAGERYEALELCVFADRASLTDDPAPAVEALAADFGITPQAVHEMPHTLIGNTDAMAEKVLLDKERYGVTYRIVLGAHLEAMAPVIKATVGR